MSDIIEEVKVTDLTETEDFDEGDYLYIVHDGVSQKISVPQLAQIIIESGCGDGTTENPFPFGCFVDYTSYMTVKIPDKGSICIPFDCFLRVGTHTIDSGSVQDNFYMSTDPDTLYASDSLVTTSTFGMKGFYIQAGMYIGESSEQSRKIYIYPLMNGNVDTSSGTHEFKVPLTTIINLIETNKTTWFTDSRAGVYGSDSVTIGKTVNTDTSQPVYSGCTKITSANLTSKFRYWFVYLPLASNYCVYFRLGKSYPKISQSKVVFDSTNSKTKKIVRFCYATNDDYKKSASELIVTFSIASFVSS